MVPIEKVEARSSVDIDDSCNNCCYGCWKTTPTRQERSNSFVDRAEHVMHVLEGSVIVSQNEIRITSTLEPVKLEDGRWEMIVERISAEGPQLPPQRIKSTVNLAKKE